MLSLKSHGTLDYVTSALLVLSPFLFGFASVDGARNVFTVTALMIVLYSLFTSYHTAVLRVIPLGVHMSFDAAAGLALALAPWVFGYRAYLTSTQEIAHYGFGLALLALVGLTRERTEADKRAHHVRVRPATAGAHG